MEKMALAWFVTRAAINARPGLTMAVHAFAHGEWLFLPQTHSCANGAMTHFAFSACLRMLSMAKAYKSGNLVYPDPVDIPVLLSERG